MALGSRSADPPAKMPARRPGGLIFIAVRVTGLLLVILALGHFAVTHIITDVAETGSGFVARRWSTALWVTWDALLLVTAVTHAACALVAVIHDHRTQHTSRKRWLVALGVLAVSAVLVGAANLIVGASRG